MSPCISCDNENGEKKHRMYRKKNNSLRCTFEWKSTVFFFFCCHFLTVWWCDGPKRFCDNCFSSSVFCRFRCCCAYYVRCILCVCVCFCVCWEKWSNVAVLIELFCVSDISRAFVGFVVVVRANWWPSSIIIINIMSECVNVWTLFGIQTMFCWSLLVMIMNSISNSFKPHEWKEKKTQNWENLLIAYFLSSKSCKQQ